MRTIVIAAGGTGGHLYPGIALAHELRANGYAPLFVVREQDMSIDILRNEGFAIEEIPARGFPRRVSFALVPFVISLVRGLVVARALLRRVRPDAVVGMGGYISFPVIMAARWASIPSAIHEQNCLPGLANRLLARWADLVAVSSEEARRWFSPAHAIVTGNPLRRDLFGVDPLSARRRLGLSERAFTVVAFGGSQGARGLNDVIVATAGTFADDPAVQFLLLTGTREHARIAEQFRAARGTGVVLPYLAAMGDAYAAADMAICRAGATTVAELAALHLFAVLVPYPHATADHQFHNALSLSRAGAAMVIREKDLTVDILCRTIGERRGAGHRRSLVPLPDTLPQQLLAAALIARCPAEGKDRA